MSERSRLPLAGGRLAAIAVTLGAMSPRRVGLSLSMMGLAVAIGWAVGTGHAALVLTAIGVLAASWLVAAQRGIMIGILVLAGMNGLPYIDTSGRAVAAIRWQDVAAVGLVLLAGVWLCVDDDPHQATRAARALSRAGAILLAWWLVTVGRTVLADNVSVLRAADYGRDFLYFALLIIVLPRVRLTADELGRLLATLAIGVGLYAIGQLTIALGAGNPTWLVHADTVASAGGLQRVYAYMIDLVIAGLAASVAAVLLAPRPTLRTAAVPLGILLTASVAVQQTRARWIGLGIGFVGASMLLMVRAERGTARRFRRRARRTLAAMAVAGGAILIAAPSVLLHGTLIERALTTISDLETTSGSVAAREQVINAMVLLLGGKWLIGLGFVSPSVHYFPGLPNGSIRNPDVGVFNAIMTMGVIGAALIYVPVVVGLVHCVGGARKSWSEGYSWLRYGGAVWIIATLVSSITLVTLFSVSGLILMAIGLTVVVHPSAVTGGSLQADANHDTTPTKGKAVPWLRGTGAGSCQRPTRADLNRRRAS